MSTVSLSRVFEGKEHACAGSQWVVFPGAEVWSIAMVTMHVGDIQTVHSSQNPASPPGFLHSDYTGLRFLWAQAGGTLSVSDFSHHFSHLQIGKEKMYPAGVYWATTGNGSFGTVSSCLAPASMKLLHPRTVSTPRCSEASLLLCCILSWFQDCMVSSHMREDGSASGFSVCSYGIKGGNYQNIEEWRESQTIYTYTPITQTLKQIQDSAIAWVAIPQ